MSNKILVENFGTYQAISASYDDNMALSSSLPLTLNTASYVSKTGLMQIYNKQLMTIPIVSISEPQANYSGSVLAYTASEGFVPLRLGEPSLTGDISGTLSNDIKVVSVSNVQSGLLSSQYGGTSGAGSTSGSLILATGSGPVYGQNNKLPSTIDAFGTWEMVEKFAPPSVATTVYLYTGSISGPTVFTWTKPSNFKFFRVICQGGGGGGAGGTNGTSGTYTFDRPGAGGAGGGYSDSIFGAFGVPTSVTVTVGRGGQRGPRANDGRNAYGGAGGDTTFGGLLQANGGVGGKNFYFDLSQFGGLGYFGNGGNSFAYGLGAAVSGITNNNSYWAAPGGGRGLYGVVDPGGNVDCLGGTRGLINLAGAAYGSRSSAAAAYGQNSSVGHYFFFNKCNLNGIDNQAWPAICSSGAGGSAYVYNNPLISGGNGLYGAGGGGGGSITTNSNTGGGANGGFGGAGYVLIICY